MLKGTGHLVRHVGNKPYECTVCKYRCSYKYIMVRHFRIHSGEKPYTCSICDFTATVPSALYGHMSRFHPNIKPFQCFVCNQTFTRQIQLRKHLQLHTAGKKFKCSICDYSFSSRLQLTRHLWTHAGIKPFKCTVCDYAAAQPHNLRHHMERHQSGACINRFKCSMCEKSFSNMPLLKGHLRKHGIKPYKCTICDYSSNWRANLEIHCRRHTGEMPYQCTVCDYCAMHQHVLDNHVRHMHPGNEHLKCSICHVTFGRRIALSKHMRLHMIEHYARKAEDKHPDAPTIVRHSPAAGNLGEYNVDTAGHPGNSDPLTVHSAAGDVSPNNIDKDEDRANGELSTADAGWHGANLPGGQHELQCDVCSKRFDTEMMLSRHLRQVHIKTGLTKNTSKVLSEPRTITQNQNAQESGTPNGNCSLSARYGPHCTETLSSPTRRHLQGKCYQCPLCDYTSRLKRTLETHYRRHTGEKPFKCRVCDYAAIQSTPLYAHMENKHPGMKPFKCNSCGETFDSLTKLRRHIAHGKNAADTCVPSFQLSGQPDAAKGLKRKDLEVTPGDVDREAQNCNTNNGPQNEYRGDAESSDHHDATADTSLQTSQSIQSNTRQGPRPGQEGQHFCKADTVRSTETGRNTRKGNFKCTTCSYSCKTRQTLEDHLRRHTGEKPFKCRVCGYAAAVRSNVHSHMKKKHPSVRPFICTVCNKAFGTAKRLRHHSRLHIGATASKMTSSTASKLKIKEHNMTSNTHQQPLTQVKATVTHNIGKDARGHGTRFRRKPSGNRSRYLPAKPYNCPLCTYSCSVRSNLAAHVRIHTREKPYKCTLCEYAARQISRLYAHMRTQHPGANLLTCTVCGAGFITPRTLMMHLKLHMDKGTDTVEEPMEGRVNQDLRKRGDSRYHMYVNIADSQRTASMLCDSAEYHENDGPLPGDDVDAKYQCDVCKKQFDREVTLFTHLQRVHIGTLPEENGEFP